MKVAAVGKAVLYAALETPVPWLGGRILTGRLCSAFEAWDLGLLIPFFIVALGFEIGFGAMPEKTDPRVVRHWFLFALVSLVGIAYLAAVLVSPESLREPHFLPS